jgi:hypothetical protein
MTLLEYYENGGNPHAEVIVIGRAGRYSEGRLSEWTDWGSPEGRAKAGGYCVHGTSDQNGDEADEGPYVVVAKPGIAW